MFEGSRGLMEAVVLARGEGEVLNKRTEVLGESELKTTLQRSVTLTVILQPPKYLPLSDSEPLRVFSCHHCTWLAFRGCFAWILY